MKEPIMDKYTKMFSTWEVYSIIQEAIRDESRRMRECSADNNDRLEDIFLQRIYALSELYKKFDPDGTW